MCHRTKTKNCVHRQEGSCGLEGGSPALWKGGFELRLADE